MQEKERKREELHNDYNPIRFGGFPICQSVAHFFPIREGLTLRAHGYVEWRAPVSYLLPMLRDLTGSYRTLRQQERQDQPQLQQRQVLP